ncbi:MAG: class I SAM-dependent methyltransferase [Anaerolineales bacterium]
MNQYDESTYGERIAGVYDEMYASYDENCIEVLSELAQGGPALELGIGSGRIALPLQRTGVEVHGIDASTAMLDKLREKPGGVEIPVTVGNFADVAVEGQFTLVYVVFNTFYALLTQEDQIRCFQNVTNHLKPSGHFVIEAFVPDLKRFTAGQTFRVANIGEHEVSLDASQHDPVKQQVTSRHILLSEEGVRLYPVKLRYAWPSEFDLMARLAGLSLVHRWGDWNRSEFSAQSGKHISVYKKV